MSSGGVGIGKPPATSGREQRRKSKTATVRTPDLSRFYRYHLPPITPGEFEFELTLLRPRLPPISLDRMVETLEWIDEQAILTGSITAHRPDPEDPTTLPITRGHLVRCRVLWDGPKYTLWTMRCGAPQTEVDTGTVTIALKDDLALLDAGEQDWFFRKTKARTVGYFADEIAREVARRLGVRVRQVAQGTVRQTLVKKHASGLEVLKAAYQKETSSTGRSFVIRLRDGQLEVVPLARNPAIYVLESQIQTALITQKAGRSVPTTVLTGKGHIGKGSDAQKVSYTEFDRRIVDLYGHVPNTKHYGHVDSHAQLRAFVKRDLAKELRLNDTVTIQHQGIPFIARGDGVEIRLPREGYSGENGFVYATRADHTVQAGTYQSTWDFTLTDPFLAALKAEGDAKNKRAAKRIQRRRPKIAVSGGAGA